MNTQTSSLIAQWHAQRDNTQWVLGVIYKTEGPCYRKAGAIMFFSGEGQQLGLLSGGCLEADIQNHARKVMRNGQVKTLCYDANDEDDISFQLGIGCGGTVYIALMPISQSNNYLQLTAVHDSLNQRHSGSLELKIPKEAGEAASRFIPNNADNRSADKSELIDDGSSLWLTVGIQPEHHLLVVGGGIDAKPVVSIARTLGWEVTVWDSRPANARRESFMAANTILDCPVEELGDYAKTQCVDAVILMTHNIALDAASLNALSAASVKYLGILGPLNRKQQVLQAANLEITEIKCEPSGPAGFELGGELPESIALSILSECHARFHGFNLKQ